ncbi:MAG: hypothetical protein H6834_15615 [Planctomycetes bacterium]|nr:hypothetical protein [Planctomycetota bacterium]
MMRTLAVVFVTASFLPAQTNPCLGINDQNTLSAQGTTAFSFAGATSWGYQFVAPNNLTVQAATIFTTNQFLDYSMSLEIWSEDPSTNLPGVRLGGGTCIVARPLGLAWQGANFDADVQLQGGTNYWFVWIEAGGMDLPYEPGGTPLPSTHLVGGSWSMDPPRELKFRLYCNLLDAQNVSPAGDGCASSQGGIGRLFTNHAPTLGNIDFQIEGTGFPPGAATLLLIGIQPGFVSLPIGGTNGCFLHTDVVVTISGTTGTNNLRSLMSSGNVAYLLPVPGVGVAGAYVSTQLVVLDMNSPLSIPAVTSNGLRFVAY